jgi:hypothetical protein
MKNVKFMVVFILLMIATFKATAWPSIQIPLTATANNDGSVTLTWINPTNALSGLDVRYDTRSIGSLDWSIHPQLMWLTNPGMPGTSQMSIVTGLTPGTNYYFAIKVENSSGSWSTMSTLVPVMTGNSGHAVTLVWNPSISTNITGYKVYYGLASMVFNKTVCVAGSTNVTIDFLVGKTTYYFAATAVDAFGVESQYSIETSYSTPPYSP